VALNHIRSLGSQTVVYGLSSIVSRFLNYLLTPLYTRIFLPSAYGDITILYAYATFLNIVLTYGMETGFFYYAKREKSFADVYGTAFFSLLFTTILFALLSFQFLGGIADFLQYKNKEEYVTWFILILSVDSLTAVPFAKLRQQNKAFKFAFIKLLNVLVTIFFNVLLLWIIPYFFVKNGKFFGLTYNVSITLIFIANFVGSAFTLLLLLPDLFKEKVAFSFNLWKRMIGYSFPLLFVGLIGSINETLDRILLQKFLPKSVDSTAEIGIYGACLKIAVIMTLFIQMFRFAAEPFFFNQAKKEDQKTILADVSKYFIIYGLVIFLGVIAYIDIFKYFVGIEYRSGIKIVAIYLIGTLGLGVYFNLSFWYKLDGRTYFGILISGIGAVITVVLNVLFIPKFSYVASAWTRLICYVIVIIISYVLGQKYYPINYQIKIIAKYIVLCLILFLICFYIKIPDTLLNFIKNTMIFIFFVYYLEKKEKIISVFIKKNEN
jgi:O-antigen/teichoic acid export membrane protein